MGDITALDAADGSFDYVVAFDIFEHLSPDSIERALDEATRVARRGLALTFFNMTDIAAHEITPRGVYHWNTLSRSAMEERLRPAFPVIQTIVVAEWLATQHGYPPQLQRPRRRRSSPSADEREPDRHDLPACLSWTGCGQPADAP